MQLTMAPRDYHAAIEALNKLQTNFAVIEEINRLGKPIRDEDLVPEMLEWVRRIGYSSKDFDKMNVLHVTGTKGKGSTCAFAQSILLQYRQHQAESPVKIGKVGLYTSPHLKSVRERIMIDGQPISAEKFARYFFQVYDRLDQTSSDVNRFHRMGPGIKPNYFRYLTLMSFHTFMQEGVDSAIYEVGIGGEYDSTNVFEKPTACAVGSLGIDHVNVLGDTIEKIAWNKAGIFKKDTPAFTLSDQPGSGLQVLEERAKEKGALLKTVSVHPGIESIKLGLAGEFQRKNATLAAHLVSERVKLPIDGKELPPHFVKGLENASWPGRCQIIRTPNIDWYIDGAHTSESLEEASKWFASVRRDGPVALLFNQQKRDNVEELLTTLYDSLKRNGVNITDTYFSTNQSWTKGFQADMISHNVSKDAVDKLVIQNLLAQKWKQLDPGSKPHVCASLEEVVKDLEGSPAKQQVFVTGSLLMVGGLLSVIDP